MSNHVTSLLRSRRLGIGLTDKAVLLLMGDFASDDGSGVWCSKGRMARELEAGERTIQRAIERLIAAGFVHQQGRKKHENGFTYEYRIDVVRVAQCPKSNPGPPSGGHLSAQYIDGDPQDLAGATVTPVSEGQGSTQDVDHLPPDVAGVRETPVSLSQETPVTVTPKPPIEPKEEVECLRTQCAPAPEKPPPKHFLSEHWQPTPEGKAYAERYGLVPDEIKEIANDFRAYWSERREAKAKRTPDGWRRTWQGWVRRAAPEYLRNRRRSTGTTGQRQPETRGDVYDIAREAILQGKL